MGEIVRQCGCLDRKTGQRCTNPAVENCRGCLKHRGNLVGKYSSVLPPRMLKNYEEGLKDPEILHLNDDIAVAQARTQELMKRVDKGESGALWEQLYELKREYQSTSDPTVLSQLLNTITKGRNDSRAWAEIKSWQNHKQSLIESQSRLLIQMHQVVSLAQVFGIITKIGLLFERYVKDQSLRDIMSKEIGNLIDVQPLSAQIPKLLEDDEQT